MQSRSFRFHSAVFFVFLFLSRIFFGGFRDVIETIFGEDLVMFSNENFVEARLCLAELILKNWVSACLLHTFRDWGMDTVEGDMKSLPMDFWVCSGE